MTNEILVTCFADLKDSTPMTERLGHIDVAPFREEFLRVGEILATDIGGDYIKNIGDNNMVTFRDIQASFIYAAQLQQFYEQQPNYEKAPLTCRIGLYLGVVDKSQHDAFGSGVNQAARVEGKCVPGDVWINDQLVSDITKVWGETNTPKYFKSQGLHELKGIEKPAKQELFSFNWHEYLEDHPENSLASLVRDHLQYASVRLPNLPLHDLARKPSVIWPVTPRDGVNAIHCGQIEIIRLLAMLGSSVYVLIADCGVINNRPRTYSEKFKEEIERYAGRRGIKNIQYGFMSDLFQPRCEGCDQFHRHFQTVVSQLKLEDLIAINYKTYEPEVKDAVNQLPTLDFLHPALTIAAVLHVSDQIHVPDREDSKCAVIAGFDENIQWESALASIPGCRGRFGVLLNPILEKKEGNFQGHQTENWPLYFSWDKCRDDMDIYNSASWLTKLHLYLYNFPSRYVKINGKDFSPKDWQDDRQFENSVNKNELAKQVFDNILSI
ncbi:adenylate/guanylate cyclase domain-containing protein [Chloroflexota bacterium]